MSVHNCRHLAIGESDSILLFAQITVADNPLIVERSTLATCTSEHLIVKSKNVAQVTID